MKNNCCKKCEGAMLGNPELGYTPTCSFHGNCKCHQPAMEECKDCKAVDDLAPSGSYCPKHNYKRPAMEEDDWSEVPAWLEKQKATPATTEKDLEKAIDDCQNELFQTASNSTDRDFNARLNIQRNVLEKHFRQLLDRQKAALVEEVEGMEVYRMDVGDLVENKRDLIDKDDVLALLRREER